MASDIPETLFSVRIKTRIYQYIKPVTETKYSSDTLKILLDRFRFPVNMIVDMINFMFF